MSRSEAMQIPDHEEEGADSKRRKLLHDLRGPVVNIAAFHSEVSEALNSFNETLKAHMSSLPDDVAEQLTELMEEDILACLEYAEQAANQMNERINEASREG